MATIGRINIQVGAQTGGLSKGLATARASITSFTSSIGTSLGSMAKFGSAIAGVGAAFLGLRAGFGTITDAFEEVDSLAKTSDKLGLATEKLAGLRHAAELTGAGTRTLDMGLQRMTRRISEAAQGSGEAVGALDELGLNAKVLAQATPDQAFAAIADAMQSVENQSDRVRLAFKLFDSEGVNLVNTLALGSKGLEDAAKEADSLGLAVSRVEAAKIEMANDAITRMKSAFAGVGRSIAVSIAPLVTEWLPKVVHGVKLVVFAFKEWEAIGEVIGNSVALFVVRMANEIHHFATVTIPTTLNFISENWRSIFEDIFNFTKTVFTNLLTNAKRLGEAIIDAMQGKGFSVDFIGLSEGFKRATEQLVIPDRIKGDMEKELESMLSASKAKLGQKFQDEFAPQIASGIAEQLGLDSSLAPGQTNKKSGASAARAVTGSFLEGSVEAIRATRQNASGGVPAKQLATLQSIAQTNAQMLTALHQIGLPVVVPFSAGGVP